MGLWASLKGTTQSIFQIAIGGVKLRSNSGLEVTDDTDAPAGTRVFANVTAKQLHVTDQTSAIILNSDAAGSAADWTYTIQVPSSGMSAAVTLTLPTTDGSSSEFLQTNGSGVLTWAAAGDTALCSKINSTTLSYGDTTTISMFTLPADAVIEWVRVIIDTAFNGTTPTMSVGVNGGSASKYMASTEVNLKGTAKDIYYAYPGEIANGSTEAVELYYSASSSTAGSARIEVSYATPA